MESTETRRLSTGGQPPRRIRVVKGVDRVPTHDGILCYSAWEGVQDLGSEEDPAKSRPQWGLQIYDTTPECGEDALRLERLVLKLYKETQEERSAGSCDEYDRIDLYALPMPPGASDDDRAEKCKAHYVAERKMRNALGIRNASHYIPRSPHYFGWEHAIMIIVQPEEAWDEGEGGFLQVMWERSEGWEEESWSLSGDEEDTCEQDLTRYLYKGGEELGGALGNQREDINSFMVDHCHPQYEEEPDGGYRVVHCTCELCLPESEKSAPACEESEDLGKGIELQ